MPSGIRNQESAVAELAIIVLLERIHAGGTSSYHHHRACYRSCYEVHCQFPCLRTAIELTAGPAKFNAVTSVHMEEIDQQVACMIRGVMDDCDCPIIRHRKNARLLRTEQLQGRGGKMQM